MQAEILRFAQNDIKLGGFIAWDLPAQDYVKHNIGTEMSQHRIFKTFFSNKDNQTPFRVSHLG